MKSESPIHRIRLLLMQVEKDLQKIRKVDLDEAPARD